MQKLPKKIKIYNDGEACIRRRTINLALGLWLNGASGSAYTPVIYSFLTSSILSSPSSSLLEFQGPPLVIASQYAETLGHIISWLTSLSSSIVHPRRWAPSNKPSSQLTCRPENLLFKSVRAEGGEKIFLKIDHFRIKVFFPLQHQQVRIKNYVKNCASKESY